MASTLRRLPGRYTGPHPYQVSGSLDGLTPGRREIERLIVKRLGPDAREGLAPLAAFKDLRRLELEWPEAVDLSLLAGLELELLRIEYGQRLDLGPLAGVSLKHLDLVSPRDCTVPSRWPLDPSLESFGLMVERPFGGLLRDAVAAVPWAALRSLRGLALGGRGNFVDLGFLADLPQLEVLDVRGLRHRGPGPSPFAPPFEGLSVDLAGGLSEVDDEEAVRAAWEEHRRAAGRTGESMAFRALWDEPADEEAAPEPAWEISAPADDGDPWSVYGSLCLAAEGRDGETEYDALRVARRRLREADPALPRRLDFDPEANGTGIMARSREDLEAALRILGLTD
jgi:hypothetical protein